MPNTHLRYHWTDAQKQKMKALYLEGYSFADIGEKMGVQRETIRFHLKKMGVPFRGRGMQTEIARAKYSGRKHHGWKGGRFLDHGYWSILKREHPHADQDGYVREHRFLMERYLLKTDPKHPALSDGVLDKAWTVHHKNGDKQDNRLSNLEVMPRGQHHSWLHYQEETRGLRFEILRLQEILERNKIPF